MNDFNWTLFFLFSILANKNTVIPFVWLKSQLFLEKNVKKEYGKTNTWGLTLSCCNFLTSLAKTVAAGTVESIQLALIEMMMCPPFFKNKWEFKVIILAWSGWATSAKIASTIPINILYLCGWRASSIIGIILVLFFAILIKSRPERWENSTA